MFNLSFSNYVYICMIGFQLAGALVLLINQLTKDGVVQSMGSKDIPDTIVASTEEEVEKKCETIIREKNKSAYSTMHLNRCAFIYLFIGYFISIWASVEGANKCIIAIISFLVCLILTLAANFFSKKKGCHDSKNEEVIKHVPNGTTWIHEYTDDNED